MLRVATFAVLAFMALPILLIAMWSFSEAPGFSLPPERISFKWYANVFAVKSFVDGLVLSALLAVFSSAVGLVVATAAAFAIVRWRFPGRGLVNALVMAPLIVPEVVIGLSLLIWLNTIAVRPSGPGLYLLHLIVVLPYMVRILVANLQRADPNLENAAVLLGASPFLAVVLVTLPTIGKGIAAALLFAFVISFHNFTASFFLITDRPNLPAAILQYIRTENDPTIAALSTLLVVCVAFIVWIADRWLGIERVAKV